MSTHHTQRRFGGKIAALAVGAALALAPSVATAAPAPSLGTAPLAPAANITAGPVAGFEDNAARAVYWILNAVESDGWTLDRAIAVAGAGYGEAVRDEVLDWARTDGLAATENKDAYLGKLAQVIGIYGENPATFIPGTDIEEELLQVVADGGPSTSIWQFPFIVWGLAYTDGGVPEEVIDILADEQEDNGLFGFQGQDVDTSGWVIQALLAAGVDVQDDVIQDALEGFAAAKTTDGGYGTDGAATGNTNSTAIVAQVLRATGDAAGANAALSYLEATQVGWLGAPNVPVGQITASTAEFERILDGYAPPAFSVNMVMDQVPAAFGPNAFGFITADGSISERPEVPLVFPEVYGQTTDEDALLVAHWLQEEITEKDGLMPNFGAPDWGITLDALISLAALGTGTDAADIALERFAEEGETYVDYGLSQSAKSAYVLLVYGEDPRTFFDGRDLLQELRDGIEADGAVGEFADAFGQAFALLVFERTAEGSPLESIQWLEDQQCLESGHVNYGGYGMPWEPGTTSCDVADADTTGLVVQALSAADVDTDAESIAAGLDWLAGNLNSEGAIEAWGAPSANSTSWAAQAFDAFGMSEADGARSFLKDQVIKASDVDNQDALGEADAGLVPSAPFDRVQAFEDGTGGIMDGARFATAQTGFGLGGYSLAEITALGARTAAPAPEFAEVDDGEGAQKPDGSGSNNTGSKDDEGQAAQPQKHQPSYAG